MKKLNRFLLTLMALGCVVSCEFHDDSEKDEPAEYATLENIVGETFSCEMLELKFISEEEVECTLLEYSIPMVAGEYTFESEDGKAADFGFDYLWEENMDEPTQVVRYRVLIDGEFESSEKLFVNELYVSNRIGMSSTSNTFKNLTLYKK